MLKLRSSGRWSYDVEGVLVVRDRDVDLVVRVAECWDSVVTIRARLEVTRVDIVVVTFEPVEVVVGGVEVKLAGTGKADWSGRGCGLNGWSGVLQALRGWQRTI